MAYTETSELLPNGIIDIGNKSLSLDTRKAVANKLLDDLQAAKRRQSPTTNGVAIRISFGRNDYDGKPLDATVLQYTQTGPNVFRVDELVSVARKPNPIRPMISCPSGPNDFNTFGAAIRAKQIVRSLR